MVYMSVNHMHVSTDVRRGPLKLEKVVSFHVGA